MGIMSVFIELSIIIAITTAISIVMRLLRQPLVVGYIIAGILTGPYALNILQSQDHIELFSTIGIATLLFIVGLNLNPKIIHDVGKTALITGIGQVLFTSSIGFAIAKLLGMSTIGALYIGIALTFSSTIIILKLLSDKGELYSLYGRISIGFLLVQDLVATVILIVVSAFASSTHTSTLLFIGSILIKGLAVLAVLYGFNRFVFPYLGTFIASSQELLFLFSLAWGFGLSSLFLAIGFSIEIGALIAGVSLALTPYAYEVASRIKPLRDFFIVLFFILLGSHIALSALGPILIPAIIFSLFVLIGNPLIVYLLMNILGFKRKTAFLSGLTVAQISEFSLILMALGVQLGHIDNELVALVTLVGIITIAGSTYLILYSDRLYHTLDRVLRLLEIRKNRRETVLDEEAYDIVLFGYDRVGKNFVEAFHKLHRAFLVVDFNPQSIEKLRKDNIPHKYGDAEDIDFLDELNLGRVKLVVTTIPTFETNLILIKRLRSLNPYAIVIAISHDKDEAHALYSAGASYVVMPHHLGAHYAAKMIIHYGFNTKQFDAERDRHLNELETGEIKAILL
jgi:Kef-type K+ transport system membrane component KefB